MLHAAMRMLASASLPTTKMNAIRPTLALGMVLAAMHVEWTLETLLVAIAGKLSNA